MELREQVRAMHEAKAEELSRENRGFVQVYPQGWQRIRSLMSENPTAAKVYAVLAEHIDPSCGAVVVSQDVLAEMVGVSERTIRRATAYLEEVLALVPHTGERIRLCLRTGPERGLARVGLPERASRVPDAHPREEERPERAREAQTQMMLRANREPELQLEQDFDPETGEVRAS